MFRAQNVSFPEPAAAMGKRRVVSDKEFSNKAKALADYLAVFSHQENSLEVFSGRTTKIIVRPIFHEPDQAEAGTLSGRQPHRRRRRDCGTT